MASKWDIDKWVEEAAQSPITSFYPSLPARALHMSLMDVFERLVMLAGDGKLDYMIEIRCPECCITLARYSKDINFFCPTLECDRCGFQGEIDPDMIFPLFKITPEYREIAKKNSLNRVPLFHKDPSIMLQRH